jgi:hypothetical protein
MRDRRPGSSAAARGAPGEASRVDPPSSRRPRFPEFSLRNSGAVVSAIVMGGTLADTSIGQAIAVDAAGAVYVTGLASAASHDFPTTPGAVRTHEAVGATTLGS